MASSVKLASLQDSCRITEAHFMLERPSFLRERLHRFTLQRASTGVEERSVIPPTGAYLYMRTTSNNNLPLLPLPILHCDTTSHLWKLESCYSLVNVVQAFPIKCCTRGWNDPAFFKRSSLLHTKRTDNSVVTCCYCTCFMGPKLLVSDNSGIGGLQPIPILYTVHTTNTVTQCQPHDGPGSQR